MLEIFARIILRYFYMADIPNILESLRIPSPFRRNNYAYLDILHQGRGQYKHGRYFLHALSFIYAPARFQNRYLLSLRFLEHATPPPFLHVSMPHYIHTQP
jgi:hypothetical protein